MKQDNKKLYEAIMNSIAKEVKKTINEMSLNTVSRTSGETAELAADALAKLLVNNNKFLAQDIVGIINNHNQFMAFGEYLNNYIKRYSKVFESYDEQYSYNDQILEEYGLSYIFVLNEDNSPNIFQKFKQPLQDALNKVKNKFGNRPCKILANIVKKAQTQGRLSLYGVLTAITLLSGTIKAGAVTTTEFGDTLSKSVAVSSAKMAQATGDATQENKEAIFNNAFNSYVKILNALEDDSKNRYAASGVGCADTEAGATHLAKQDVLSAISAQYGDNAVEKYDLKFKTICTKSYNKTAIGGGQTKTVSYYTVIMVAYQEING